MLISRYETTIAKRYLLPGKGEGFIFLVTSISLVAVMLGVAALVVVMSVMNGFHAELFNKTVGLNGHAIVQGYDGRLEGWRRIAQEARRTPGVTSATPLIEQPLMASFNGRVEGVIVRGMTVADIRNNPVLNGKVVTGSLSALAAGSSQVAIGSRLAEQLGARPGSEITLISPDGQVSPFGSVPRIVAFKVAAIFEIGIYDYDNAFVVMPIEDAQQLLLMGDAVGMVEVVTQDPERVDQVMPALVRAVGSEGVVMDWRQLNTALFEALAIERVSLFVVLSIIILVAAFNILSSLIMLVRAKTRDIAILRTMGASSGAILRIFVAVGLIIGIIGTGLGLLLGFLCLHFRQSILTGMQWITGRPLWDPSVRFLNELPALTDPAEVLGIALFAILLSFLATLYPAARAARTDPVQVLRYE